MDSLTNHHRPSPNTSSSNSSTSSSTSPRPTTTIQQQHQHQHQLPSPRPINRSESINPYPTTFVQADTSSFKQVVQMLTGSPKPDPSTTTKTHNNIPPIKSIIPKKQSFKLYERRNSLKHNFKINPLINPNPNYPNSNNTYYSAFSPRKQQEILSPSILDFPSLVLSPVTPLIHDPFDRSGSGLINSDRLAEEKAIKDKGFYFHRSPATTPRGESPRLLPLFPVTSPRSEKE